MNGRPRLAAVAAVLAVSLTACGTPRSGVESAVPRAEVPEGRLPEGVRPLSYRLSLEIVPERDGFSGSAMITIELDEPSERIWMHGERLEVTSIYATHATTRVEGAWKQRTPDGVAEVRLREPLPAGRSTLHVEYTARFDAPLKGLYRVRTGGEAYAFTQFESISARLAFPCFDEPRFKTPFELTLTVPADEVAAANTPVEQAIPIAGGMQRVSFITTPPLPTYLVAFAVGPLDVVQGETIPPSETRPFPIPLRGIAAKGRGPALSYALDQTAKYVLALERYFGMPYPYRKLDLVAVPDFAAGAMENVGLITFREWLLLLRPEQATEGQRRAFAYVMAHELAHQWFGNLVTMPWWNDIWLNEAFATWMGNKIVHLLHPEYRADLAALASAHRAMRLDSLSSARSIRQPILSNHDIKNAFDLITYEKGGAVLSMFEHWMGEDAFRKGIRLYLRRHEWTTATSSDLLAALDEVTPLEVSEPFLTFLTQPGVPLLASVRDDACADGTRRIELAQQRYLPLGSTGKSDSKWQVPLCISHEDGRTCDLLARQSATFDLPGCPSWWMPNDAGAGYFRFSMSEADWTQLRKSGFRSLSDKGKLAVADSLDAAFAQGSLDVEGLLPWFPRFVASPFRQLAAGPMSTLRFIMYDGASPDARRNVVDYGARLYRGPYRKLGWRTKKGDSSDTKLLREAVLRFMVMDVRDGGARARAVRLGNAYAGWRRGPGPKAVDPQLASLALAAAVQDGDAELFEHLVERLRANDDATERNRILVALGHAEDPVLAERALALALDPGVRRNEISRLIGTQFRNPRTRRRAWQWLKDHFDELLARVGPAQAGGAPWYAASLCSEEDAEDVERFFEPRVSALEGGPRNLASVVEAVSLCAAKAEAQRASIDRAFSGKR